MSRLNSQNPLKWSCDLFTLRRGNLRVSGQPLSSLRPTVHPQPLPQHCWPQLQYAHGLIPAAPPDHTSFGLEPDTSQPEVQCCLIDLASRCACARTPHGHLALSKSLFLN